MKQQPVKKQKRPQRISTKFCIIYYLFLFSNLLIILTSQEQLRLIKLVSSSARQLVSEKSSVLIEQPVRKWLNIKISSIHFEL